MGNFATKEDAPRVGSALNCAHRFREKNVDTKLKNENFAATLSVREIPPCTLESQHSG